MNKILMAMAGVILQNLSAELKAEIREGVNRLETKAQATKNPFDDLCVMLLKGLIGL